MLTRQKDALIILLVIFALGFEVLFLLHQMRIIDLPLPEDSRPSDSPPIGTVLWKAEELRHRSSGNLSWYALGAGDAIRASDLVMTGREGSARLKVEGNAEIHLGPDTLIQFSAVPTTSASALAVDIQQGVVQLRSEDRNLRLGLRSQQFDLSKSSEVLISSSPLNAKTRVEVREGELSVVPRSGERTKLIKQGEVIEVGSEREVAAINLPLPFTPLTPPANSVWDLGAEKVHAIEFSWQGEEADTLEVSLQPNFVERRTFPIRDGRVSTRLPAGLYFWRTRLGVRFSEPARFVVRPNVEIHLIEPAAASVNDAMKNISFKWKRVPLAQGYTLQVATDPAFTQLVLEKKVDGRTPHLSFKTPKPGKYFWRVRAEHQEYGDYPFSDGHTFSTKEYLAPPEPTGVKILPKNRSSAPRHVERVFAFLGALFINPAYAETSDRALTVRLKFEWKSVKGAMGYVFEVSETADFKTILKSINVKTAEADVELTANQKYFWRVTGIDADGERGFPSVPEEIAPGRLLKALVEKRREDKRQRDALRAQEEKHKKDFEKSSRLAESLSQALSEKTPEFYMGSVGVNGAFVTQNVTDRVGSVSVNGFPMGRVELAFQRGLETPDWEGRLWYQPLEYLSQNSEISGSQPNVTFTQVGGSGLWKSPLRFWGQSIYLGAHVERVGAWERVSTTQMKLQPYLYAALLGGMSFYWGESGGFHWRSDLIGSLSVLGQVRGAGLLSRNIIESTSFGFRLAGISFRPRAEINVSPSLRFEGTQNNQVWSCQVMMGVYLVGEFASYGAKQKRYQKQERNPDYFDDGSTVTRERSPGTRSKPKGEGLIKEGYPDL